MSASLLLNNADKALGIAAGVGSLLGSSSASSSAYRQYKYQSLLNAQQQQYARENAETEYNRQRQLTVDNYSLQKQGIQQAGFNAALLGGTSTPATQSAPGIAAPSAGSAVPGTSDVGVVPSVLSLLSSAYASLETGRSTASKTPKEVEKLAADTEKTKADTAGQILKNEITESTIDVAINTAFADFDKIQAETAKTQQERENLQHQSDILQQELRLTTFDADHVAEKFNNEQGKLKAEISKLKSSASLDDANKALADITARFHDMGIGISNDLLGTAVAVLASGNSKLFDNAISTLKQLFNKVVPSASDVVDEIADTVKQKVSHTSKTIQKGLKSVTSPSLGRHFGQSQR